MITLLKLGGSLITDKTQESTLRPDVLERIAREIADALTVSSFPLIIGHGSGSFGHFEAKRHNTIQGVQTQEEWHGFAAVSRIAAALNFYVADALGASGVPVMRFQASASAICNDGTIFDMAMPPIYSALDQQLVPLVYGDVAFDEIRGGTIISTETIFSYLTSQLEVSRILLVGEVDGVLDESGTIIPHITPDNFTDYESVLGGSKGVDVTGGMYTKVKDMLELATHPPYPDVYILNGLVADRIKDALNGTVIGTRISR